MGGETGKKEEKITVQRIQTTKSLWTPRVCVEYCWLVTSTVDFPLTSNPLTSLFLSEPREILFDSTVAEADSDKADYLL